MTLSPPSMDSVKLPDGSWFHATIPQRATVRHAMAADIENPRAGGTWDHTTHPYRNWGYRDSLDWQLLNHKRLSQAKRGVKG